MATFHLKVLTVDKQFFDGEVDRIVAVSYTHLRAHEIDVARAREAADRAKAILQKKAGDREMDIAQGKLKKAVNRIRIAESK